MELLSALLPLLAGLGVLSLDVSLCHRLSRRYYRLLCVVPMERLRVSGRVEPGRMWESPTLVMLTATDGVQARDPRKKRHTLLRVSADGRVRAGAPLTMWLCLLVMLSVLGLMTVASATQPVLWHAALLVMLHLAMLAGLGALLRWEARKLRAEVEAVLTAAGAAPAASPLPRPAAPETVASAGASGSAPGAARA